MSFLISFPAVLFKFAHPYNTKMFAIQIMLFREFKARKFEMLTFSLYVDAGISVELMLKLTRKIKNEIFVILRIILSLFTSWV